MARCAPDPTGLGLGFGTVTVYCVSFNATANGTDTPQVTEQQYFPVRARPCRFRF